MYMYIYIHLYLSIYIYMSISISMCIYVCIVLLLPRAAVSFNIHVYVFVCIYIYIYRERERELYSNSLLCISIRKFTTYSASSVARCYGYFMQWLVSVLLSVSVFCLSLTSLYTRLSYNIL